MLPTNELGVLLLHTLGRIVRERSSRAKSVARRHGGRTGECRSPSAKGGKRVRVGWSEHAIVGAALAAGLALFSIFIGAMFAFCSAMRVRANVMAQVAIEIPYGERLGFFVANVWGRD